MKQQLKSTGFILMTYIALLTAAKSLKYITSDLTVFDPLFRDKYAAHLPLILTHGIAAIIALTIGPFQFMPWVRKRAAWLHRFFGRTYMVMILLAAPTGFVMGTMAFGGKIPQTAFCLMATLWLFTAWRGYVTVRMGDILTHRNWMIRNYALTFGAVTLRLYLVVLQYLGFEFETIYSAVAWFAWVPNLLIAEIIVRQMTPSRRRADSPVTSASLSSRSA